MPGNERTCDLAALLGCLQVGDSLFPTGRYTLSYGLETFAAHASLDLPTLEAFALDHICDGTAPSDGVALAVAHRAALTGDLDLAQRADARLSAVKLPREQREASIRAGRAILNLGSQLFDDPHLPAYLSRVRAQTAHGNQAVAMGLVLAGQGVPQAQAVATEMYAVAAGLAAAAVRLGVSDHRTVQLMLHRLKPSIARASVDACDKQVADIGGCTPWIDVMAMRHERAALRLFMT